MPAWFSRAKFGIFIHWGVYSVPAWKGVETELYASYSEWYYANVMGDHEKGGADFHNSAFGEDFEYRDFAPLFRAELFDPDRWASLFRQSGARYVVLTSKHHDGYCLWPTDLPCKKGWNSGDSGPRRDLVGELTDAVRREGMKMGLYYSIPEWETHRTGRRPRGTFLDPDVMAKYGVSVEDYVDTILEPQLKDLINRYSPSLLFSDGGEWDYTEEYFRTREFLAWLYNNASNRDEVVVNDRWALGMPGHHGDYYSSEYCDTDAVGPDHPWEENRGIGQSYGFNRAEQLGDYNTPGQLIGELADIVSRGGNLLLNVGPAADGRIPVYQEYVLREIGAWLEVNGEGIYDSEPCRWLMGSSVSGDCRITGKDGSLYLIFTRWPESEVTVPGIRSAESVSLLGSDCRIGWDITGEGLRFTLPVLSPSRIPCSHAWTVRLEGIRRRN